MIRLQLALLLALLGGVSAAAQVVITPATPPAVYAGATFQFTANVPVTWSMAPGSLGTINPTTGLYSAPPSVTTKQSYGSCQVLPNNHIFNTRIDNLPVHPSSAAWLSVANTGSINYIVSFPLNYVDASTPVQNMVFVYTPLNNGPFQIPAYPNARIESGWFVSPFANYDRHLLAIDTGNCNFQEIYNLYPVGSNTVNPCLSCTSQSGVRYSGSSYGLAVNGATNAAGLYNLPLTLHMQELVRAVAAGGTINHALRVTVPAGWLSSSFIWPAMTIAPLPGPIPYGARFRLKSSFNVSTFSPTAQVLLRQLQQYGVIVSDTGYQWQIDADYEKYPPTILSAFNEISAAVTPAYLEAVDESSLMLSPASGDTKVGAETVVATTATGATAQSRVVLTGVTIGVPVAQKYIQVGTPPQQLTAWVHGSSNTGVTWTMNPAVGTLTLGGLYTPPASVPSVTTTTVTATSNADSAVNVQVNLTIFPAGTIRIINGSATPYTDTKGDIWAASTGDDGGWIFNNGGPYATISDAYLYQTDYFAYNDLRFDFAVPNGNYLITAKFAFTEAGGAGYDVNSLEVQGQLIYPKVDIYVVAGGRNQPFDYKLPAAVTNNQLSFVIRRSDGHHSFISALQIAALTSGTNTGPPATPISLTATPH